MLIPCKEIAQTLEQQLRSHIHGLKEQGTHPKLVTVLLGNAPEQLSFVRIKRSIAEKLDIGFEFVHFGDIPPFEEFLLFIEKKISEADTTGIIIQHPLPQGYDQAALYRTIPLEKEIEGHTSGSSFQFPLSLAVLSGLKFALSYPERLNEIKESKDLSRFIINFDQDMPFFQQNLGDKKIVIAGRGPTGGKPIARAFDALDITYDVVTTETEQPEAYFKQADILITATGKKIITPEHLKEGVILLNVGLRKEDGKLLGDYDEHEIKDTAAFYTETPGGLGPLDVLYLYKNLIQAIEQ